MADWTSRAACKSQPSALWFPAPGDHATYQAARAVCAGCPVKAECLDFAISTGQEHGIWAGTSPRERGIAGRHRTIVCGSCGHPFGWSPPLHSSFEPKYCSASCRNEARRQTHHRSYLRGKMREAPGVS